MLSLPIAGLIGYGLLAWRARLTPDLMRRTLGVALPPARRAGAVVLANSYRPGGADDVDPGAVAVAFILAPLAFNSRIRWLRIPGTVLVVLVGLGALVRSSTPTSPTNPRPRPRKRSALPTANAPRSPRWRRSRASRAGSSSASSTSARG